MERKRQRNSGGKAPGAVLDAPQNKESHGPHYWIIDSPKGPTSSGVCKFCGKTQEFDNWGPDSVKYSDISEVLAPSISEFPNQDDKGTS